MTCQYRKWFDLGVEVALVESARHRMMMIFTLLHLDIKQTLYKQPGRLKTCDYAKDRSI